MVDENVLRINGSCRVPLGELEWKVSRSGGPGGQHANTSDTRVEVRFDIEHSPSLGPHQRARLVERFGPIVTATASDTRSQARNRELALERLRERLALGLRVRPARRATRPTKAATKRRVESKRKRSETKRNRGRPSLDD